MCSFVCCVSTHGGCLNDDIKHDFVTVQCVACCVTNFMTVQCEVSCLIRHVTVQCVVCCVTGFVTV